MLNYFKTGILLGCIGNLLFGLTAFGADFHSPRTDGLGGAGHASPLLTDAIYLNPSFTSFVQNHAVSAEYLLYNGGTVNTPVGPSNYYGHNLNVSILDGSSESLFQAGAGYTVRNDASLIHVGASKSFLERYGVGMGSKVIFPSDGSNTHYFEGSISASSILSSWFQTSFIVDNLFETATYYGFYREFILGTKFNVDSIILLLFDPNWTPDYPTGGSHLGYQMGVEFPFFRALFLRIGMFKNSMVPFENLRGDGYGVGLGWVAPRISFDYAFSDVVNPIPALSHNFQVTVFF